MKLATLLTFPILIYTSSGISQPPFYYGSLVRIVDKGSIYYNCTGIVDSWVDNRLVVQDLCGDFSTDVFEVKQVKLLRNRIGKGQGL